MEWYQRSKLAHTAAASKTVPSWKRTSVWRAKVQVAPSSDGRQERARPGSSPSPPGSWRTSVSKIWAPTRDDDTSAVRAPSSKVGSVP